MSRYARISIDDADHLIARQDVIIVDIRDPESFQAAHMENAQHLDNAGLQAFIDSADRSKPVVVCCYHGNMSQSAGEFLAEQGFSEVYSLNGGFTAWSASYPEACEPPLA